MALNGKFLHTYSHLPAIPPRRLIMGIFTGLFFAFCFYCFLYMCRESLRLMFFVTEDYDMLVLSDSAITTFNLLLAYIATILGQSLCFTYWFEISSSGMRGKYAARFRAVINDQRSMNSQFLNWFSRVAYAFALTLGGAMGGGLYIIQTIPDNAWIAFSALILVVLFLHTWINLRRLFNGKSFKWMIFSIAILSILSLGMSQINLIDYRAINEVILSKNIFHSYRLQLPEAAYNSQMERLIRRRATLWIAEDKDSAPGSEPVVLITHEGVHQDYEPEKISIDSLESFFPVWDQELHFMEMHYPCVLFIHRDIKMEYVNKLRKKLAIVEANRIEYAIIPPVREYDERYYNYLVFPLNTGLYFTDKKIWKDVQKRMLTMDKIFDLHTTKNGEIVVDNAKIKREDFIDFFIHGIRTTPNFGVKYHINNNATFDEYIFIMNGIMQALHQIRKEYALRVYQQEFEEMDEEDQLEIRINILPYRILEIPEGWFP